MVVSRAGRVVARFGDEIGGRAFGNRTVRIQRASGGKRAADEGAVSARGKIIGGAAVAPRRPGNRFRPCPTWR